MTKEQYINELGSKVLENKAFAPSRFLRCFEHYDTENVQNERKNLDTCLDGGKMPLRQGLDVNLDSI